MFKTVSILLTFLMFSSPVFAQSGRVRPSAKPEPRSNADFEPTRPRRVETLIPEGTLMELRLEQTIDSRTSKKGEVFTAPVAEPVVVDGRMILPASAAVVCRIINVEPAARKRRNGSITIGFEELVLVTGERYRVKATLVSIADRREDVVDEGGEGKIKSPAKNKSAPVIVGTSGGIGATIGAIGGGAGGAATGGAIGAGVALGSVLLTKGQDITLVSGMRLQIRLDKELELAQASERTESGSHE